jgi:Ca2+-transporting ATPase
LAIFAVVVINAIVGFIQEAKAGLHLEAMQKDLPRVDSIPFESQHQYMATLHEMGADMSRLAYLKGSIESLLPRCTTTLDIAGEHCELDRQALHHAMPDHASGFCYMNDSAIAISELAQQGNRIVYLDLDVHHADGLQVAGHPLPV